VWIEFKYSYPVSYDTGSVVYTSADTSAEDEPSAARWLRAIPQRFFLPPQGSQVVRVLGLPPEGTRNGEYWAQVVISSKERRSVTPAGVEPTMRIGVDLVTRVIVPFHFRRGPVTSGILVRDVVTSVNKSFLRVRLELERSGNASFWGRVNCRLIDAEGKVAQKKEFRIAVYNTMTYVGEIDITGIRAGEYTLELRFDGAHPAVSPKDRIKSNPIVQTVLVSVP
jgi:hypothetical protein